MTIEQVDFDLTQVLEDTADLVADTAQRKGVELATWIHPNVPRFVNGDSSHMRQVLANLVSNAVKFTAEGEVVIEVQPVVESDTTATMRFQVRDTGIGIPEEAHERLFDAFSQADGSTTRRYGGTGLGLAISRRLVSLLGGDMGFESVPGQGSTFWFTLTLGKREGTAQGSPVEPDALDGLRVLIVDDNATNREILHRQIATWRMRDDSVANGLDALAHFKEAASAGDPYRLAILDLQMPDMDGMSIARAIKADPTLAATRIVVLTSLAYHADEANFRQIGISAYLTKPVKASRLLDCVSTVMSETARTTSVPITAARKARTPPATPPGQKAIRILLAEDNPVNQRVVRHQLAKLGFAADAVANGEEALAALERVRYDLVLMDGQMPEMDGYEAVREIRRRESAEWQNRRHRVVAITASSLDGDRQKCLDAGMDDYLAKPVRLQDLHRVLEEAVACLRSPNPEVSGLGSMTTIARTS
jgi:CheY-like chemotaxis protein